MADDPFMTALQRQIQGELARPQTTYRPVSQEYILGPRYTQRINPATMQMESVLQSPGQRSQFAEMSHGAAAESAALNAQPTARIGTLLGGYGQAAGAAADQARVGVMQDELDWKKSLAGQRFAMDVEAARQPGGPAANLPPGRLRAYGWPVSPDATLGEALPTPVGGTPPATADAHLKAKEARGNPAMTPEEHAALMTKFGPEFERNLRGDKVSLKDRALEEPAALLNAYWRMFTGREVDVDRIAKQKRAARSIGVPVPADPAQVGVREHSPGPTGGLFGQMGPYLDPYLEAIQRLGRLAPAAPGWFGFPK